MTTLYNIEDASLQLLDAIGAAESDEERAEYQRLYNEMQIERDQKLSNICAYIVNCESDVDAYAAEIKRLQSEKKTLENKVERLKALLKAFIPEKEKWKFGTHSISWRKSTSLQIDETEPHPLFTVITKEHDKDSIRQHLEGGGSLPFARFVEKQNIQVK